MLTENNIALLTNNKISIEGNNFINVIQLPENYWSITLSQQKIDVINRIIDNNNGTGHNMNKNLYLFKEDSNEAQDVTPNFLRPRQDWNIHQGDYIVKERREIKRKFFTKKDLKNILGGFWYITLTAFLTYYILNALTSFD